MCRFYARGFFLTFFSVSVKFCTLFSSYSTGNNCASLKCTNKVDFISWNNTVALNKWLARIDGYFSNSYWDIITASIFVYLYVTLTYNIKDIFFSTLNKTKNYIFLCGFGPCSYEQKVSEANASCPWVYFVEFLRGVR